MSSNLPTLEPIFQGSKRSQMELSKALATLGFGAWNELEPAEAERKTGKSVKTRLNDALQKRLEEVEKKREKMIILDKKIAKLGEGPEKRKLVYQKQTQDNYNRKHKKAPIDEERAAHESYQILLKEYDMKKIRREREELKALQSEGVTVGGKGKRSSGSLSDDTTVNTSNVTSSSSSSSSRRKSQSSRGMQAKDFDDIKPTKCEDLDLPAELKDLLLDDSVF